MGRLSLAVVVQNDVEVIGLLLNDVLDLCDELLVIDTGSSDDTLRVAEALGAKFYYFKPTGNEGAVRNFAREKCSGDWILYLDPYDRMTPQAKESFRRYFATIENETDIDVVSLHTRSQFISDLASSYQRSSYRQSLVRNREHLEWGGVISPEVTLDTEEKLFPEDSWIEHRITPEKREERLIRHLQSLESAIVGGDNSSRTLIDYAKELQRQGRIANADEFYERATYTPLKTFEHYELLVSMSICSKELGEIDECRSCLGKAIALDSGRAEAYIQLGALHFAKSQWDRAFPFFRAASVIDRPKMALGEFDETAYTWLSWDYLSVCASEMGKYKDALDFTFRALPGNPERERLLANMKLILQHQRQEAL